MAGHTVSKPFNPPSWLTVFVTIMTISGIISEDVVCAEFNGSNEWKEY